MTPISSARRVELAIERDLQRSQLTLPFPDEKTIDMARACRILHVCEDVVRRLMATPLKIGGEQMCIAGYNTMRNAPTRIDYTSLVNYLDDLRERHGIPDRRDPPVFGRHRDEDLLPFRWSDTITVEEAADVLSIHRSKVLLRIEAGQFYAYQLTAKYSPWRISRTSLAALLESFKHQKIDARPYAR